jgi:hypothetical protein
MGFGDRKLKYDCWQPEYYEPGVWYVLKMRFGSAVVRFDRTGTYKKNGDRCLCFEGTDWEGNFQTYPIANIESAEVWYGQNDT